MPGNKTTPDWMPIYQELADKLVPYRDRQEELISMLEDLRSKGLTITPLNDRDASGPEHSIPLTVMDPFTFFGTFNRQITTQTRVEILRNLKSTFQLSEQVPSDFSGVPVLNNQNSWLMSWAFRRKPTDVPQLWDVFVLALGPNPLYSDEFARALEQVFTIRNIKANLTMGLFWIRPYTFLSLDQRNCAHLKIDMPKRLSFDFYRSTLETVKQEYNEEDFPRISHEAWLASGGTPVISDATEDSKTRTGGADQSFQKHTAASSDRIESIAEPYTIDTMLADGVFLAKDEIEQALERWKEKKNLILQGAPGVGKTFVARKLSYALLGARDKSRLTTVQFHPAFAYEDFVRGYRPTDQAATFKLIDGPLLESCNKAEHDPDHEYVMMIDEINRANLSQVFGELLMLLEYDKRGEEVTPLYRRYPEEKFRVPKNLFVIGTMNVADRSLALIDYALRRRFAFLDLEPQYSSPVFREWLEAHAMNRSLINRIVERMTDLNNRIANDRLLGPTYQIGHSFFCPPGSDFSHCDERWYREIVKTEIEPLLKEYWYDRRDDAEAAAHNLLM